MAAELVFQLHGECLCRSAASTDRRFQGFRSASFSLRRDGVLGCRLEKQLTRLDDAFAVIRHIDHIECTDALRDFDAALKECSSAGAAHSGATTSDAAVTSASSSGEHDGASVIEAFVEATQMRGADSRGEPGVQPEGSLQRHGFGVGGAQSGT